MFGRLLTPLKARFELSPRPDALFEHAQEDEMLAAENFARDVLIEVMRKSVESLKEADDLKTKIEVCTPSYSSYCYIRLMYSCRSWVKFNVS